jgi:hypothetical protein
MNKINKILESLKINYKSWIFTIISIILLSHNYSIINSIVTYFVVFFLSYITHYQTHIDTTNASIHLYHHENNNFFSHFIQILLEFTSLLAIIPILSILELNVLNPWIIIFFYFFYTTVHNVNYSILHVNNVHEKHHKMMKTNIGPDICDIIFNTKFDDDIENTDHYIINIIISFLFVYFLQHFWIKSDEFTKNMLIYLFNIILGISGLIIFYYGNKLKNIKCKKIKKKTDKSQKKSVKILKKIKYELN